VAIHKLNPAKVKNAKQGKHEDGGGLRLVVSKAGAKKWILRVTVNGKRREMGLGSFPDISLAAAREEASEGRKLARKGTDPIEARRVEVRVVPTFVSCAAQYIRAHRRGWKNRKHAHQWVRTLKTYARPVIGSTPVNEVSTDQVLQILQPVWTEKTETAKRVQGRIESILDFAAARGLREPINPARWRGHLDTLLPRPSSVKTVRHHPAMPYGRTPAFYALLKNNSDTSSAALRLKILTATRTGEVLKAEWSEFDLDKATWTIPASRMKSKAEHRVPLTDEAIGLLNSLPRIKGCEFLFVSVRYTNPLSDMSLLSLMRRMGFGVAGDKGDYVPHGFRSTFRDWAGEVSHYPRDVAEMALAHTVGDKVEAAYRRGDLFDKRRAMMRDWSDYVTSQESSRNVIQLRK